MCTLELRCGSAASVICAAIVNFGVAIVRSSHPMFRISSVRGYPHCSVRGYPHYIFYVLFISSITMPSVFFISVVMRELYPLLGLGFMCHLLH